MEAKLTNKPVVPHYICDKDTKDYFTLWLDPLSVIMPYVSDCWVDNIRLIYDDVSRTTSNVPGVDVRVPKTFVTDSMEWIDPSIATRNFDFGAYFTIIAEGLRNNGYENARTLFGAPYDFRRGPSK